VRYHSRRHNARTTDDFVFHQLLPYLGSKRHLLPLLGRALAATGVEPQHATFVDAFAGSGVVARFAKWLGFAVVANDLERYAEVVNTAALRCDAPPALPAFGGYDAALARLDALPGSPDWVTRTLCPADDGAPDPRHERMFYRRATGARIDAIREQLAAWQAAGDADDEAFACLLTPLLYQACWLANTSGVFKGFHAGWGGKNGTALHRILADLRLRPLRFFANGRRHHVHRLDAAALPAALANDGVRADVVYLDPPYNQHPYASNYHVLDSLVRWDRPELPPPTERGQRAAIRPDWRERRSAFNDRHAAPTAFAALLERFDAPHLLVSYSTDGTIPLPRLVHTAAAHGALAVHTRAYKRYRTSPTRPSPRPRTLEFVLHVDRRRPCQDGDAERVLQTLARAARRVAAEAPDRLSACPR
jgi:adenine-specific DNA-methyltransferase